MIIHLHAVAEGKRFHQECALKNTRFINGRQTDKNPKFSLLTIKRKECQSKREKTAIQQQQQATRIVQA